MGSRLYGPDYFSAFRSRLDRIPLQALILFTPADEAMMVAIRSNADTIQDVTGEHLAALVPVDMTAPWVQSRIGQTRGLEPRSAGAWALLDQFVTLGGIRWDELPVMVVGRSAFTGPRLVFPTSPATLPAQLDAAVHVARDLGDRAHVRNVGLAIAECLPEGRFAPRTVRRKTAEDVIDGMIASLAGVVAFGESEGVERRISVQSQLNAVSRQDRRGQPREDRRGQRQLQSTAAAIHALSNPPQLPEAIEAVWSELDDDSRAFLSTAVVVTDALAATKMQVDYAAAGLPLCKLFERQLNLAPVQVARRNRGVPLPDRYTIFDPELAAGRGVVDTSSPRGQPQYVNINELDSRSPSAGHRFLTLGEGQHLLRVMVRDNVLRAGIDARVVADLRTTARQIGAIRNQFGAHAATMPVDAFERLRTLILESGTLVYLARLATTLRT